MSATMVASSTKAVPHVVSSIQNIPLAKIPESKTNLRRLFDEAKLAELIPSIRCKGVLLPLLARPVNGTMKSSPGRNASTRHNGRDSAKSLPACPNSLTPRRKKRNSSSYLEFARAFFDQ
jgi:hypothetical protein